MNRKGSFDFTVTGFIIGLIMIAMAVTSLGLFMTGLQNNYNITIGNNSLYRYDATAELLQNTEDIRDATSINQSDNFFEKLDAYFSSGFAALKTSWNSFSLFGDMLGEAEYDLEFLRIFGIKDYIYMMILIALLVGVGISALIRMKI